MPGDILLPEDTGNIFCSPIGKLIESLTGCWGVKRAASLFVAAKLDIVEAVHPFFEQCITATV